MREAGGEGGEEEEEEGGLPQKLAGDHYIWVVVRLGME